jgi:endonuclease-3
MPRICDTPPPATGPGDADHGLCAPLAAVRPSGRAVPAPMLPSRGSPRVNLRGERGVDRGGIQGYKYNMKGADRVAEIIRRLMKEYPEPRTALNFETPFQLLAATVLSAQSTDTQVNRITEGLFKKYRNARDFASVPLGAFQKEVSGVNFYKTKARNIHNAALMVVERFGGRVPRTMEELVELPGVARKTANIILSNAYGVIEGVAVDTHVKRLSQRLGLTKNENPVKIERDLMEITPRKHWADLSHLLIFHGRKICVARKPRHGECVLFDICPSNSI